MQAGKRYTLSQLLRWQARPSLLFIAWAAVPVALHEFLSWHWVEVPWQPLTVIGIAVAFYLGFKNNSSYERLWEARKIWGGIVNASRTFTIMTRDFITNHFAPDPRTEGELGFIHKTIVHRHIAWLFALTYQLRKLKAWEHDTKADKALREVLGFADPDSLFEQLKPYLSTEDYDYLMTKGNKASHILSLQSMHFKRLRDEGLVDDFRHMELGKMLQEFYTLQGKSERIKNFPLPRQYATVTYYFVCLFIFLIPLGMMSIFDGTEQSSLQIWLSIPFSALASWVFWNMMMIGDYSENPFEGLFNDVPITSMARSIEIDIRQMLEETDLPEPIKPMGEFNLLM